MNKKDAAHKSAELRKRTGKSWNGVAVELAKLGFVKKNGTGYCGQTISHLAFEADPSLAGHKQGYKRKTTKQQVYSPVTQANDSEMLALIDLVAKSNLPNKLSLVRRLLV